MTVVYKKIGQVSLPVLSRKGRYDVWSSSWVSNKNYTLYFSEDLFLKHFIFMIFMYGFSKNKHFFGSFFKKIKNNINNKSKQIYNLDLYSINTLPQQLNNKKRKHYISNVYICRLRRWLFIYLYIFNLSKTDEKIKKKVNFYFNKGLYNSIYSKSKINFFNE